MFYFLNLYSYREYSRKKTNVFNSFNSFNSSQLRKQSFRKFLDVSYSSVCLYKVLHKLRVAEVSGACVVLVHGANLCHLFAVQGFFLRQARLSYAEAQPSIS